MASSSGQGRSRSRSVSSHGSKQFRGSQSTSTNIETTRISPRPHCSRSSTHQESIRSRSRSATRSNSPRRSRSYSSRRSHSSSRSRSGSSYSRRSHSTLRTRSRSNSRHRSQSLSRSGTETNSRRSKSRSRSCSSYQNPARLSPNPTSPHQLVTSPHSIQLQLKELRTIAMLNNHRISVIDRRLARMEVSVNKVLITISDLKNGINSKNTSTCRTSTMAKTSEVPKGFKTPDFPMDSMPKLVTLNRNLRDGEFRVFLVRIIFCLNSFSLNTA